MARAMGLGWLSEHETQRLQAMRAQVRRDSFIAGHWQARQLAAQWLRVDVSRIGLGQHPDGRPQVHLDGDPAALHLSLSHSGDWLALALASVPVGVDIELPRKPRDWLALAQFVCSPSENARLVALPATERSALFHTLWTLKEARGKRNGEGLRPAQTRALTAQPCDVNVADAMSWTFAEGALALAVDAGTQLTLETPAIGQPSGWRCVAEPGGAPPVA